MKRNHCHFKNNNNFEFKSSINVVVFLRFDLLKSANCRKLFTLNNHEYLSVLIIHNKTSYIKYKLYNIKSRPYVADKFHITF